MSQRRIFLLLGVVLATLILGVAYAAISNVTLNVSGNAAATPNQGNFKVAFTGTPTVSGNGQSIPAITGDTTAIMNVSGLTKAGESTTTVFTIANTSTDITAYLSKLVTNNNTEYFKVTATLGSNQIAPVNGTTTLSVKVELMKTPIAGNQTDTINIEVVVSPTAPSNLISFKVEQQEFYAEEGMTWAEWCESGYDTGEVSICEGCGEEVVRSGFILADDQSNQQYQSDVIQDGGEYGQPGQLGCAVDSGSY